MNGGRTDSMANDCYLIGNCIEGREKEIDTGKERKEGRKEDKKIEIGKKGKRKKISKERYKLNEKLSLPL